MLEALGFVVLVFALFAVVAYSSQYDRMVRRQRRENRRENRRMKNDRI
jgi:hypothetical protein